MYTQCMEMVICMAYTCCHWLNGRLTACYAHQCDHRSLHLTDTSARPLTTNIGESYEHCISCRHREAASRHCILKLTAVHKRCRASNHTISMHSHHLSHAHAVAKQLCSKLLSVSGHSCACYLHRCLLHRCCLQLYKLQ